MTTNADRAARVIGEVIDTLTADKSGAPLVTRFIQALDAEGLIMPDQLWVEAQYRRNYDTGRYERYTRTVGEWVKDDD